MARVTEEGITTLHHYIIKYKPNLGPVDQEGAV